MNAAEANRAREGVAWVGASRRTRQRRHASTQPGKGGPGGPRWPAGLGGKAEGLRVALRVVVGRNRIMFGGRKVSMEAGPTWSRRQTPVRAA